MSDLVLASEPLNRILDGKEISKQDAYAIFDSAKSNTAELYQAAKTLRSKHKGNTVTFSKKAFFNLVNLCRDTCSYCTY
ncbi:MAG: 7,8-didemethyl-8-hydroxy-5-deazariboflavin synthase subunit CofG, partial [Thaumarchaeota archaeon]|nr:7,8-didemethyl-8-hydroxy-5-deazariboflavin synthase subunit CofG [Nitrososphaerota archaeon]